MSTSAGLSTTSPIKFGTSGWRGVIAEDFTFASVRLALTAIAEHVKAKSQQPSILVGYDTRFYSEEFSQLAVDILQHHGIRTLLCETFTPTPAVAFEIMRRKLDGAIKLATHNFEGHGRRGRERLAKQRANAVMLQDVHGELREFFGVEARVVAHQDGGVFRLGFRMFGNGSDRQANIGEGEIVGDEAAPSGSAELDGRGRHEAVF